MTIADLRKLLAEEAEGGTSFRYEDRRLWMEMYGEPAIAALPAVLDRLEACADCERDFESVNLELAKTRKRLAKLERVAEAARVLRHVGIVPKEGTITAALAPLRMWEALAALDEGEPIIDAWIGSVSAPTCHECGSIMVRDGVGQKCTNCGEAAKVKP